MDRDREHAPAFLDVLRTLDDERPEWTRPRSRWLPWVPHAGTHPDPENIAVIMGGPGLAHAYGDGHEETSQWSPPADTAGCEEDIRCEVAGTASRAGLQQLRRRMALRFHPDRLPPHLREDAQRLLQEANMLIDDALKAR